MKTPTQTEIRVSAPTKRDFTASSSSMQACAPSQPKSLANTVRQAFTDAVELAVLRAELRRCLERLAQAIEERDHGN